MSCRLQGRILELGTQRSDSTLPSPVLQASVVGRYRACRGAGDRRLWRHGPTRPPGSPCVPRLDVSPRALRYFPPPPESRPTRTDLPGRWPLLWRLDHQSLLRTRSTGQVSRIPRPADTRHVDLLARTASLLTPPPVRVGWVLPQGVGGDGLATAASCRSAPSPAGCIPKKVAIRTHPPSPPPPLRFPNLTRRCCHRPEKLAAGSGACRGAPLVAPTGCVASPAGRPAGQTWPQTAGGVGGAPKCARAGGRRRPGGRELPPGEAPRRRLQPRALGSRLAAGWRIRRPHAPHPPLQTSDLA